MPRSCSWHPRGKIYQRSNRKDYKFLGYGIRDLYSGERIVDKEVPGAGAKTLWIFKDSSYLLLISHAWFELGHLHVEATGRFHQNGRIGSDDYWSDLEFDQQFECIEKNSKCTPDQSGDPLLTIRNGWGVSVGVTVKFDPQAVLKGTLDITIQYICTTATITQTTTTTAQLGSGIPLGSTAPTTTISPQGTIALATSTSGNGSITDTAKITCNCVALYDYGYPGTGIGVGNLLRPPG
jgi:hypothetical protein